MTSFHLSPPELLTSEHLLDGFECGEPSLDDWLKRRALKKPGIRRFALLRHLR